MTPLWYMLGHLFQGILTVTGIIAPKSDANTTLVYNSKSEMCTPIGTFSIYTLVSALTGT